MRRDPQREGEIDRVKLIERKGDRYKQGKHEKGVWGDGFCAHVCLFGLVLLMRGCTNVCKLRRTYRGVFLRCDWPRSPGDNLTCPPAITSLCQSIEIFGHTPPIHKINYPK